MSNETAFIFQNAYLEHKKNKIHFQRKPFVNQSFKLYLERVTADSYKTYVRVLLSKIAKYKKTFEIKS